MKIKLLLVGVCACAYKVKRTFYSVRKLLDFCFDCNLVNHPDNCEICNEKQRITVVGL